MSSRLHVHSQYSLLDGYATPKENLDRANEIGLKAIAVTEHGNEYSFVYYDMIKKNYPELKIIYGVEFYECFDMSVQDKDSKYFHLIVLAKNENGRKILNKLVTKSNLDGFYYKPRIDLNAFKGYGEDLIVLSACLASKLAREVDYNKCVEYINEYKKVFPFFYLEMQSSNSEEQVEYNKKLLQLSKETNTPFTITTDSHAATKEDLYYQGRLVQIAHDTETMNEGYSCCYLQTDEEIHNIMDSQIGKENVDIGLLRSDEIAELCDIVNMPFQEPQLPTFPLPDGFDNNHDYLKHLVYSGWKSRGFDKFDKEKQDKYKERLEYELDVIHKMGFDGYFLIVWDFINFARNNNVMVGSGRGSCAGSLVCFALYITDLDPIKYGLIFERFLNPERISMPDTDTDVNDREKVINYLINKYGENRVCQIINFSFITPVVAIKDVGKVLGFKYAEMDKLSKKFTYNSFQECLDNNPSLLDMPQYEELLDIASHLSGRVKTVSMHAGGVGIVDTDISDYMGMKLGKDGEHVIQVDKRVIENIGIIKFDILGVQTLSLVSDAMCEAGLNEYDININNPKFEYDKAPYGLLNKALTNGVFQVESAGMKDLLLRLKAENLEDLSAVLALYRPDSMGALEEFIECKHDPSKVKYIHPDMKPILESTYGCCIRRGQLISTEFGNIPIENVKVGDYVYTHTGKHKVLNAWCNGVKKIFKLKLNNGKEIQTTDDHKILTQNGWKMLRDICETDVIAMRVGNSNSLSFDKNKLKMIGYLLGDGGLNQNNGVHFYNSDDEIMLDFKQCVEEAYQDAIVSVLNRQVPSGSYVYDCTIRSKIPYSIKQELNNDLKQWGMRIGNCGANAQSKSIPNFIFRLNTHCMKTMLGAYLDSDGSYTSRGHIRFKTVSYQLSKDVQELIRLIGYNSTITPHNDGSYDIVVSNSKEFSKELYDYSLKLKYLYDSTLCTVGDYTNCIHRDNVVPITKLKMKELGISGRESQKKYNTNFLRTIGSKRNGEFVTIQTLAKIKDDFDYPELWFDKNIHWQSVKEIVCTNEYDEVYDLEIENDHSFVVNGIIVHNCIYQEQILEIVRKFGGRTYGGADLFRKAIGKKDLNLVKQESEKLYQEIVDNGYSKEIARAISNDLAAKGGYCFNRSHSYSYAVLCFQTAWLKTYYSIQFFKALFNLNKDKAGMINKYILDAKLFDVNVLPPHINKSDINFSIVDNSILFGLSAISKVGETTALKVIEERNKNGEFKGFNDLSERLNPKVSEVVAFIKSGAIPSKNKKTTLIKYLKSLYTPLVFKPVSKAPSYKELIATWGIDPEQFRIGTKRYDYDKDKILETYNNKKKEIFDIQQKERFQKYIDECNEKYLQNEEFWEFEALQIFINDNPFEQAYSYMSQQFEDVKNGDMCTIVGIIAKVQKKKDRHGKQFAYANIYSSFGLTEAIIWHSQLKEYEDLIVKGKQVAMYCKKDSDEKVIVEKMKPYTQWISDMTLRKKGVVYGN